MADNQNISPDDQDLQLARIIGEALPDLAVLENTSNPLLSQLLAYKSSASQPAEPISSEAVWDSIQSEINESSGSARILHFSPTIRRYAVAAAVVMVALVGSFFYQQLTAPALVGESFATAETLTLPDGSAVTLRPYSALFAVDVSDESAEYKLTGEAYFEVSHDPSRTFSVRTDQSEVRVLGTRFILSDWGSTSTVYLQEGRIQYTALNSRQSVQLEPGQSSSISETTTTPQVTTTEETPFTDWLNNELVFQNKPVQSVFNELEQHFNITIQAQPAILQENLSGSIPLDELDSVLGDLELVLGGAFSETGQNSYVFKPNS
ncbi:FecR family protein [Gracilimonas sediminicola]|uniref:FecR domain-containing protein n=1 Tax=Gracilimonas sediminicola TaxID=2952158 RepID=A0A9X2L0V7_9BACT|nr:FecR domain-containing protein [Gracilimonas sediminicola]MCP9290288.1 FecR domain-containing protein [Gracilimonas sediminicola]